jgi:hypothetical protein
MISEVAAYGDTQKSELQKGQGQPYFRSHLRLLRMLYRQLSKSWREQFCEDVQ